MTLTEKIKDGLYKGTRNSVILGILTYNILATYGTFDKPSRTKEAIEFHNQSNPIKEVVSVDISYSLESTATWQPIRHQKVIFTDGSKVTLDNHIHWLLDLKKGEPFDVKPGERYEVAKVHKKELLVKKVE